MATAKQLAALKKARAARAKKSVSKTTKKTTRKSNPEKYVVYVVNRNRNFYFTGKSTLDTNIATAKIFRSKLHAVDVASVLKLFGREAKVGKKS